MGDGVAKRAERVAIGTTADVMASALSEPPVDMKHAAILVAIHALKHGVREGLGAVIGYAHDRSPDGKLEQAIAQVETDGKVRALIDMESELVERLEERAKEDPDVVSASLPALTRAWERVWERTADAKKRRVINAAFVRSFDKESYEEGLSLRFFRILEALDYPELELVMQGFEEHPAIALKRDRKVRNEKMLHQASATVVHLRTLLEHRLVWWPGERLDSWADAVLSEIGNRFRRWLPSEVEKPEHAGDEPAK